VIDLGEKWGAEHRSVFHACAPDVRTPWLGDDPACACGALVPRRVRNFRDWLVASDNADPDTWRGDGDPETDRGD
jgi:hypothetical protein